jgi:predicted RNA-binding protein associated with RNAse of E/G family
MGDLHRPKTESFDIHAGTNTDPKGFARPVDRWDTLPGALYMARAADHPRFGYLESWLIPALTLRVNRFHFRSGSGHGPWPGQELYVDIADVVPGSGDGSDGSDGTPQTPWTTTDLYVDLVTYAHGHWELLDLDELGDALAAGFLDAETGRRALTASQRLVTGMIDAGGVEPWLAAEGYSLSWANPGSVTLAPPEK